MLTKYWGEEMRTSRGSGSKELEIQVFFALKAVSLAFSSKQIKAGFPTNTLGHWLLRRRSVFNQVLHVIYTFTPFLPELRMMLTGPAPRPPCSFSTGSGWRRSGTACSASR